MRWLKLALRLTLRSLRRPRLALDLITVRAARADGTIAATISVTVPDIDRWLKAQITDDEFYRTWTVRTRPR